MGTDYKALLEQFGKDYRESRRQELLTDVRTLRAGEPRMSFDEAWNRAVAANPSLLVDDGVPVVSAMEEPESSPASPLLAVSATGPRATPLLLVHGCECGMVTELYQRRSRRDLSTSHAKEPGQTVSPPEPVMAVDGREQETDGL